jgi:isoquinoline 1-oxidoreductase alpha subunit
MPNYSFVLNGERRTVNAESDTPLLWVIRDNLHMDGTKYGCGVGVCGACTVHEADAAIRSCQITIEQAAGKSYTTIEGLAKAVSLPLHPCQQAWIDEDVSQCGYCQPGMIMQTAALLKSAPRPTDAQIDEVLSDHVCRCGTYGRMRRAVHRAAELARGGKV